MCIPPVIHSHVPWDQTEGHPQQGSLSAKLKSGEELGINLSPMDWDTPYCKYPVNNLGITFSFKWNRLQLHVGNCINPYFMRCTSKCASKISHGERQGDQPYPTSKILWDPTAKWWPSWPSNDGDHPSIIHWKWGMLRQKPNPHLSLFLMICCHLSVIICIYLSYFVIRWAWSELTPETTRYEMLDMCLAFCRAELVMHKPRKAPDSEVWILLTIFAWVWEFLTLPLELSQAQAAQDSEQSSRSLFSDWAGLVEQQIAGVGWDI